MTVIYDVMRPFSLMPRPLLEKLRRDLVTQLTNLGLFPLCQFPLCQFPLRQFPFGQLPTLSISSLSIPIWSMLTKRELTKWEDSPFEIILTTVIDHLCVSGLLDKHIMKNIHGTLVPACSILSQVLHDYQYLPVRRGIKSHSLYQLYQGSVQRWQRKTSPN